MRTCCLVIITLVLAACSSKSQQPPPAAVATGETDARQICGACHLAANVVPPGPDGKHVDQSDVNQFVARPMAFDQLRGLPTAAIVMTLERGAMRDVGATLTAAQRIAIAEYLGGSKYDPRGPTGHYCADNGDLARDLAGPSWTGYGNTLENTRFQSAAMAKLTATDVSRLKVKWALGLAHGRQGSNVTVAGSRVFVGDQAGVVRAIDRASGCTYWAFNAKRWVRTAVDLHRTGDRTLACFGGSMLPDAYYCVDAATGEKVWESDLVDFPVAYVSTSATLHDGTLYIPISTGRELHRSASDPKYECCKGRGALIAVDAATGKVKWRTYTTPEPKPTQKSAEGTQLWGPSGASAWRVPVVDAVAGRVYVTTGQNASAPATKTSDAILALDMKTGEIVWSYQLTADDIFNGSCLDRDKQGAKRNCPFVPKTGGVDPSTPLLKKLPDGSRLLIVGDKTGRVIAFDPDKGNAVRWDKKVSPGGYYGGVHWGMAVDDDQLYVPVHDRDGFEGQISELGYLAGGSHKPEAGSLVALRLTDGVEVWRASGAADSCAGKPKSCAKAFSSPPTVIPGVVFATSLDGHVRAFATKDGAVLWDFDTAQEFATVGGAKAKGGSIDGPGGVVVVDGTVIVSSGYGAFFTMPGNVLLAFTLDGK
ncbi:MAG: PQQ-binding-like beta-propeller repeat protein [Deltaproteobacteria bacterium]|nr:PQQ-binding-like beta-propeller repeat protein [Deltaproteobacteria bacterium]